MIEETRYFITRNLSVMMPPAVLGPTSDPSDRWGKNEYKKRKEQEEEKSETTYCPSPELLFQPETRPISHEERVDEAYGIYAALIMVEAKCIDVDEEQNLAAQEKDRSKQTMLTPEHWRALIALHKTLLHEYYDFLLASQHPEASLSLSKLAEKYTIPARMWRHGIHGFLEVLRHRLPESLDYMHAFIHLAYSIIELLYENVPSFKIIWIECLGYLSCYRMAMEDDSMRDRKTWYDISRFWYSEVSYSIPRIGRLYHHRAILARPYTTQQLSLYSRSLTCEVPFSSTQDSIMTLFRPILEGRTSVVTRAHPTELILLRLHATIFTGIRVNQFNKDIEALVTNGLFDKFISRKGSKFKDIGVSTALSNIASMLGYGLSTHDGTPQGILRLIIEAAEPTGIQKQESAIECTKDREPLQSTKLPVQTLNAQQLAQAENNLAHASVMSFQLFEVALNRYDDKNILPMVHVYVVFLWYLSSIPDGMKYIEVDVLWSALVTFLNFLSRTPSIDFAKVTAQGVPGSECGDKWRLLCEDFLLRGQLYTRSYIPSSRFEVAAVDYEERSLELPSMHVSRVERILWACRVISSRETGMIFDPISGDFIETVHAKSFQPRELIGSRHNGSNHNTTKMPPDSETKFCPHTTLEDRLPNYVDCEKAPEEPPSYDSIAASTNPKPAATAPEKATYSATRVQPIAPSSIVDPFSFTEGGKKEIENAGCCTIL